jgi:tRNA G18 (ribose-2'-O)-methylase SpoU
LPMTRQMESLNVSNAAAVSMFEWMRQRRAS